MKNVEQYYKSRTQLYITCALLLTWELFGNPSKDFTYFGVPILNINAIPFLLSILVIFNLYFFIFQWKLDEEPKKKLKIIDYRITLTISFISLLFSFFYQINTSKSRDFLIATLEPESYLIFSIGDLVFYFFLLKKFIETSRLKKLMTLFFWLAFLLPIVMLIGSILKLKDKFNLSPFETVYFYSMQFFVYVLFVWSAVSARKENSN